MRERTIVHVAGLAGAVMAVVADLSDPKDPGLKKAVARVKRATNRRLP
jgi:hypothetical protein